MRTWHRQIQQMIDEIDQWIRSGQDEEISLRNIAQRMGYSEFYLSKKFREISGMQLRDG